jgi:hypothetical protein
MTLYVVLALVVLEAVAFAIAAVLHLGVAIFGLRDTYGIPESIVQGIIGLLLAICAYGIRKRTIWARAAAFLVHGVALMGALFGMLVASKSGTSPDLNAYNLARLAMLIAVPILLFTPHARAVLQPTKPTKFLSRRP